MPGPNILHVVWDTARADAFEPYGAGLGSTPAVQQLADSGAAFPMAIAPGSWTVPSHASMFTGLMPREIGLAQAPGGTPGGCREVLERHTDRLLPEVLRRAGYRTMGLSANFWIGAGSGFDLGFEQFHQPVHHRGDLTSSARGDRARWALNAIQARLDDGAAETELLLTTWLASGSDRPFYAFVNLVECHSPYMPPAPYNGLTARARLRAAGEARKYLTMDAIWRASCGGYDIPAPTIARMRHLYGESIRLMDSWLGRVLSHLDHLRVLEDTIVIVTSDHGENLGEEGLIGHCFSLDQRLVHVPFVWSGPGTSAVFAPFSLVEVPALLAAAAGIKQHPWGREQGTPGIAVSQFDGVTHREDPRVDQAVARWALGEDAARRLVGSQTAASDGRHKVLLQGGEFWYTDLAEDPLELRRVPLAEAPQGGNSPQLMALKDAVEAASSAPAEGIGDGPPGPVPAIPVAGSESEDLERQMRILGYM